jgi:signal transduction histidine kinase
MGSNQLRVALLDITSRKESEQTVQEHFEVLTRKLGFLTGELDLERFLRQTLSVLTEQDHAECSAFWFADTKQETIALHSISDGSQATTGSQSGHPFASVPVPLQSLLFWPEMRRSRRPLVLHDMTLYPQFPMVHDRGNFKRERTLLLVPLLQGQNVLGVVVLQSLDRRSYQPEEIAFALAVAQQVTIAVQMGRLGEQARQAAVLQERNRLAQEIHDTLAQGFTVILMQLEVAEDAFSDSPEEALAHVTRAKDMARSSLAAARRSVRALRPRELEQGGLPAALAEVLTRTTRDTGVRPVLDVQGVARPLHDDTETNLLRITQEALYNIQKHAEAKRIWIELSFEPNSVRLAVKDDGKGFDTTAMRNDNHFGLQVMQERAETIGGVLQLSSRPGHGTQIMITVPSRAPGEGEV